MFNLEQAIAHWRRQMSAGGLGADVLDELESHLRDDVDAQVLAGVPEQTAFAAAVQRLGQARVLKKEFGKGGRSRLGVLIIGFVLAIVIFCYCIVLPLAVRAQGQYASWLGLQNHPASFGFACRLVLGMCLGLAMPVGSLALVRMRILNGRKLARLRPHMIVVNLILGAMLTTPEVVTQIIMFVPLQALCEASIFVARIWDRRAPNLV